MIFSDEIKDLFLYKNKFYLPITDNKKTGSIVFLASPDPDSSLKILQNPLIDRRYYRSYFIEKDIMYYINREGYIVRDDDTSIITEEVVLELSTYTKLDSNYKPKGFKNLNDYKKVPVNAETIADYKPSCNSLIHLRHSDDYEGTIFVDGDNVVGYVNVDYDRHTLQAIEITKDYQGYSLGKQLLKYAIDNHKVDNLSVNKGNKVAYNLYKQFGFREYDYIGTVVFMKTINSKINESFVGNIYDNFISDVDYIRMKDDHGDRVIGFYDESVQFVNEGKSYNNVLRKVLYADRFKTPKEVLTRYDEIQKQFPEITKTYLDYEKYKTENLLVDLGYYHQSFFKAFADTKESVNLDWICKVYFDFLNRLIADLRLDGLYTDKTVILPIQDWNQFNENINPLMLILNMVKKSRTLEELSAWKDIDFLVLTDFGYFKFDPSTLQREDISKILSLKTKLLNKEPIVDDTKDSPKAIVASITDDLEEKQQIKIHSLTGDTEDKDKDELIKAVNKAAETSNTKDDALETLDNDPDADRLKELILKLAQQDDEVKISASRRARLDDARSQTLKKNIKNKSINDMINESRQDAPLPTTKLNIDSVNEEWNELKFTNFEDSYDVNEDIVRILDFFATRKYPIVARDIQVEDTSTSEDFIDTWTVAMEDYNGQRFKLIFDIPKFKSHKFMKLRGNEKVFNSQLMLIPLSKSDNDTVQVVSNYKKIFIRRYNTTTGKSYQTADILIKALNKYDGKDIKVSLGDNSKVCRKYQLPIDYVDLASVFSKIETSLYIIYFNLDEVYKNYKVDDSKGIPIAVNKNNKEVIYYTYNDQATYSDFISTLIINGPISEIYNGIKPTARYTYSQASILNNKIPLIVMLGYNYGLTTILQKANIRYEIRDKKGSIDPYQSFIKFNNGFIVYRNSYESSLLLNGIKECPTEDYPLEDMNSKAMYLDFLDLFGGRILADGLDNFEQLMIEPIAEDILKRYKLPIDYAGLLIEANNILADNDYTKHIDLSSNRFRSNEILAGYTYQCLSNAYGEYCSALRKTRTLPMSMKRSAVIDAIMADPTAGDASSLNDLGLLEAINTVSFKGLAGMNSDRSYGLDKRNYDKSMLGLLGMSTGFAGNVGLNRQATIDMNIEGKRGLLKIDPDPEKMSITKTFTITEGVTVFGATRDDPFRTAMTFIQTSKHGMRVKRGMPSLITTGADMALPYLSSNTFSHTTKKAGKVVERQDGFMIIEYDDGSSEYINLDNAIMKNSNGGFFISVKLETDLKVGDKVKPNQIVAYDPLSYSDMIGDSGDLAYNVGPLVKVVLMNTDEGFEDSTIIAEYLSEDMASDVVHEQDVTLDKLSNVYFMVEKGQPIKEGDPLIIFQNAFDENDVNILLKNLSGDEDEINELGRRTKKSHIEGVVEDIVIYRTCEKEEMSDSLKKLILKYEKPITEKRKLLEKYKIDGYKSIINADYKLPNSGKLKNIDDGIMIEFYLKYEDKMSIGDKLVYYSALKGVVKDIFPLGEEPVTQFRKDEKCGSLLCTGSVNNRMVTSILPLGGINKGLIELDRLIKDKCGIPWKYLYED